MRKHIGSYDLDQTFEGDEIEEILTSAGVRMEQNYGSTRNYRKDSVTGTISKNSEKFEYEIDINTCGKSDRIKYTISSAPESGSGGSPPISDIDSEWTQSLEDAENWYQRKFR